jgi:hypothetical protein
MFTERIDSDWITAVRMRVRGEGVCMLAGSAVRAGLASPGCGNRPWGNPYSREAVGGRSPISVRGRTAPTP